MFSAYPARCRLLILERPGGFFCNCPQHSLRLHLLANVLLIRVTTLSH